MEEHLIAIVTGGNRGIGVHVVNKLLNCGMTVIVAVRSPDRAWEEISRIVDVFKFEEKLLIESLDISATSSIRQFTERITAKFEKIDILIHNGKCVRTLYFWVAHHTTGYVAHSLQLE